MELLKKLIGDTKTRSVKIKKKEEKLYLIGLCKIQINVTKKFQRVCNIR